MSVTVRELIEGLQSVDPDLAIVLSSDAEGNNFREMDEAMSIGLFNPDEKIFLSPEDLEDDDYYVEDDAKQVVVFWPVD